MANCGDRERDSYRQRVYDAEAAAGFDLPGEPSTHASHVLMARHLFASSEWPEPMPLPEIRPTRAGSTGEAWVDGTWVKLGHDAPVWLLVHELAHSVAYWEERRELLPGRRNKRWRWEAHHGWRFCHWYLRLVRVAFGDDAWARLRTEFVARKVPHRRRQDISPTERRRRSRQGTRSLT